MNTWLLILLMAFWSKPGTEKVNSQPIELGKVQWVRSLEEGIEKAKTQQKPVFLLFQEVPGCSTCRNYGQQVLSHPLIVEAIESEFVPVAIYNNKGGSDARTLAEFGEPSWNNPVVRLIDTQKEMLVPRISGKYTATSLTGEMVKALERANRPVPLYLRDLAYSLEAEKSGTETAVVSMYCFWTGEKELAKAEGVLSTEAGFMGGREVVKVEYDPKATSYTNVLKHAQAKQCADRVFTQSEYQQKIASKTLGASKVANASAYRTDREPKYYMSKTDYAYVPMTAYQATQANSLIGQGKSPDELLSPGQRDLLMKIKKDKGHKLKSAIGVPITTAWNTLEQAL